MILSFVPQTLLPVLVLATTNICISFAWSGHLNFTQPPLWLVILASWGIARIEYCLAVPANQYEFDFKAHHQATRKGE